jgi:predicted DNA-binding transcriptional regulator YafY
MARSSEVVRQWEILRAIDGVRHGIGVAKLAAELGVHTRTIRRDLDALARAGFPLFDDKTNAPACGSSARGRSAASKTRGSA